jgi:carbon monoxide dehydrogenase subunit G
MRFLIWVGAALFLLAGLVFLLGWLLPATREGRAEVVIAAPPAQIVKVIADVEAQVAWREGISSVERSADGWVEVTARGERISFVTEEMGEARIRLRFASDAGYSGSWEAVLTPEAEGTRIAVVERAEIPSPLGRILARLFFDPEAFATTYLAALKARVEG